MYSVEKKSLAIRILAGNEFNYRAKTSADCMLQETTLWALKLMNDFRHHIRILLKVKYIFIRKTY